MKPKVNWPVILLALSVLFLAVWNGYGQKQSAPKVVWEYKIVAETDKVSLNELGAQGWELVTVQMGGAQETYYFKRAK